MGYWNFRVVRHTDEGEEWFGIHEAYYDREWEEGTDDDKGKVSLTLDPVSLCANTLDELRERIGTALAKPILEYDNYK